MVRVPSPVLAPVLGLVLMVSGCSDDGPPSGGATTSTATIGASEPAGIGTPSEIPSAAPTTTKGTVKDVPPPPVDTETPSVAISTAPAIRVGATGTFSNGVKVLVGKVSVVKVEASGPGDIAGDGVAVQLTVHNSSKRSFDLNGLAVTAFYDRGTPASPGGAGTGKLLTGSLKVGAKATGVYVFTVPRAKAPTVEIQVSSDASAVIVVYKR